MKNILTKYWQDLDTISGLQVFQLCRFAVVFLIGVGLVRLGFTLDEVSSFELFVFTANLVSFAWVMGFRNAMVSYYHKLSSKQRSSFFFNVFFLYLCFSLMTSVIYWMFFQHYFDVDSTLVVVFIILSCPSIVTENILLLQKKGRHIALYGLIIFGLQLVLVLGPALFGMGMEGVFVGLICWAMIKFLIALILVIRSSDLVLSFETLKPFFYFSLPLIFHVLLGNGMEYIDGILVEKYFDLEMFAVFRYGAKELPFISILIGAMTTALIPIAATDIKQAITNTKERTQKLMKYWYPIVCVLLLLSPFLYKAVYGKDQFLISAEIFNVYLLIISSRIVLAQVFLFAEHRTSALVVFSIIEFVINVLLSIYLIQSMGLMGIVWATFIAYSIHKVMLVIYVHSNLKIPLSSYLDIRSYLGYNVLLFLFFCISLYLI